MARKEFELVLDKKDERDLLKLIKGISDDTQKKRIVQDAAVKAFNPRFIKAMRQNARKWWSTKGDTYRSIGFIKSRSKDSGQWYVDFGIRIGGKRGSRYAGYKQNFFEKGTVERETKSGQSRGRIKDKRPVFTPAYITQRNPSLTAFAEGLWKAWERNWNRRKGANR